MNSKPNHTNQLIHETSPYLLQHAHNPVNWHAWNDEAWNKAKREDKLVLVSIGYSSCHWCHVMEHETFEDHSAARLMNEFFVCIKVDREERPDIDQVYMTAVQLMTGGGGWPLNCFCLPDGRPVYGGTYFPKASWMDLLVKLHDFYSNNKQQAETYAEELTQGVRQSEMIVKNDTEPVYSATDLDDMVSIWKKYFDFVEGGPNRSPKFPMPNNYEFLLQYAVATGNEEIKNYVLLTLDKMAFGGIYDQVGGGFARYSTDSLWKVPHFEKMLYDDAQLVSLYSHAYRVTQKDLYKNIVFETLEFISREMTSAEGGFYSALDADSEGEEGKFYVWKKEEIKSPPAPPRGRVADGQALVTEYFNLNDQGYWEDGNYILLRMKTDEELAKEFSISVSELNSFISDYKKILLEERNKRIRPGLDDKQLTSWNALMIKGYCDAYEAFGEKKFVDAATKCMNLILEKVKRKDGGLNHSYKNGKSTINGYLEDYSFMIEALIALYQCSFDEKWLQEAKVLADSAILHFHDASTGMFWFTSDLDPALITRKKEIHDNVIPASNSSIAKALFLLSKYFIDQPYFSISDGILNNVKGDFKKYPSSFSNWANLMLYRTIPFYEVVVVGKDADLKRKELSLYPFFNKILAGSTDGKSYLSLLNQRYTEGKTLIYVCVNNTCQLPVENSKKAIEIMKI